MATIYLSMNRHKAIILLSIFGVLVSCNKTRQVGSEVKRAFEIVENTKKNMSNDFQERSIRLAKSDETTEALMKSINESNDQTVKLSSTKVVFLTEQIEEKIDSIVKKLEQVYTLDENGDFNNSTDQSLLYNIMVTHKEGHQLRDLLKSNSAALKKEFQNLGFNQNESKILFEQNLINPSKETWVDRNFKNMPVIAVTPILDKIKHDAIFSRIELLHYLDQKVRKEKN